MTEQSNAVAKAEPKPQIATGGALAALVPQSLDEAFRLSQALARGGDMVPKHFQGKPEEIMAAVMRGMEIGLAPMQALSNIAVINGRATVWGDALPALMQRAGHHLDVEVTGEGDKMRAVATLTRGDTGKEIVREFTADDAKKANLWGKAGPWQTYPKRMLAMRARSWAVRDGAADALMGLQVAEEMQDAPPIRDVTPAVSPAMQKLVAKARGQDVVVSETVEEVREEPHWTARVNSDGAFPGSDAWDKGVSAAQEGLPETACPYDEDREAAVEWLGGYRGFIKSQEAGE